jgi:hypothetical protein
MTAQTKKTIREAKKLYKSCLICEVTDIRPTIRDKLITRLSQCNDSEPLATYRINQLIQKLQKL